MGSTMCTRFDNASLGNLSELQMEELLSQETVGRIGTYYRDRVYVVPINFIYQDGFAYGYTTDGIKTHMMRSHPEVCLEIDRVESNDEWRSVICWGKYEELKGEQATSALLLLQSRLSSTGTIEGLTGHLRSEKFQPLVYQIKIREKSGRFKTRRATYEAA